MRSLSRYLTVAALLYFFALTSNAFASCSAPANQIEAENCLPGTLQSTWDVSGAGDQTIQGFATDISYNVGGTVNFKINTPASAYTITIYRMGYYSGKGARQITTVTPSAQLPQSQPACVSDTTVGLNGSGLYDCGNWAVSASWAIPSTATSGIYFAKLVRSDTGGSSHIFFIVRNDASHSALFFQTSDEAWQAYNDYGLGSLYGTNTQNFVQGSRSYKVSYNRPFHTRSMENGVTWVFNAEYPMVRFLEANAYDVSYTTGMDGARNGSLIQNHKVFMSVGHDEYWSGDQRTNVETARANGVHLAFFSGNEVFWKTRWENSIDGSNTPNRTLVCYKETHANAVIDPQDPPTWTGTWRDPRFSPPGDGGRPENGLTGTIFMVNGPEVPPLSIQIPAADGKMRFWRNTTVASQSPGQTVTLPAGSLGFEWDVDADNGFRPAGLFHLSTATYNISGDFLLDYGTNYGSGTATHDMTLYRAQSGVLVFSSGSIQWSWGLDANHDAPDYSGFPADIRMQQATVNLFADMGVQPATLQTGLVAATQSTDNVPPSSTIVSPVSGSSVTVGSTVPITGTATDTAGVVGGVEVSVDGGSSWHPAVGRANWTYNWTPTTVGSADIRSRAVDDSGNLETPSAGVNITVVTQTCPCSDWNSSTTPGTIDSGDGTAGEYGVKFRADVTGSITGIRFYKSSANTGTHLGNLWNSTGTLLASATFTGESASGWQQATFSTPVVIAAGTTYVASYYTPTGHYSFDQSYFATAGVDNPPLHLLANGVDGPNAVYAYSPTSTFPTSTFSSSNYWVDVVFTTGSSNTPPTVNSTSPTNASTGVSLGAPVSATFSEPMNASTLNSTTVLLVDSSNNPVTGTVSYASSTFTATFTPTFGLLPNTLYTATVKGSVQDEFGNAMGPDFNWSFTTGAAPANDGPGGPILVISSSTNPFSRYYGEILRNEGMNEFTVQDMSTVTASTLAAYDLVILGDMPLTSAQASMITTWVGGGGKLIAMHPDKQLAGFLGLTSGSSTLPNAYLLVNTASGPGVGIVNQTIQYHGPADLYSLNGSASLATLYSNATTPTASPATTLIGVGPGQAAAFTYDLARSVVYTRQGDPAWSGQPRDGQSGPVRSDDLFFGAASFDPEPDWVDPTRVAIPQADEQQRLLVNLILQMEGAKKPLPRFWYFPNGVKAVVVMTDDDHGSFYSSSATIQRFNDFLAASPTGCSVQDWQCVRATAYLFPQSIASNPMTNSQAAAYVAQGFEIGVHADSNPTCSDWTFSSLDSQYTSLLASLASQFPSLPAPQTHRMHCVSWSDYDSQPQVELKHGIRFDTTYYWWPPSWVSNQPGVFTGSGMPMRFTDRNGNLINVYQATTQMTDESGQTYPLNITTLLSNALGATGYYGAFVANMHNDTGADYPGPGANQIVSAAQANGVPVVSSLQMLQWLDGRNSSSFGSLSWNGSTLNFTVSVGTGARNLQAMLPASSIAGQLTKLTLSGSPISFTTQTIKGVQYAFFSAAAGSYQAFYGGQISLASVTLNPTSVIGGVSSTGTVTLSGLAPTGGATVNLSSSRPAVVQVPANVLVAAGTSTANFTATTTAVSSSTPVTITGTYGTMQTATLTVNPPTLTSVTLNPSSVQGGNSSTGTVTLSGNAPTGGVSVALSSNNTAAAQVPANVPVAAGATTATFTVTTSTVSNSTLVTITGTYGVIQTGTLTVTSGTASVLLFGDQTIESQKDSNPSGAAEAFQTTANTSGTLSNLTVYLDASSNAAQIFVGLYADNGGHPGALLAQGSGTSLTAGAWNTVSVPAANVTSGTKYWIAILGTTSGTLQFRDHANGACKSESSSQSTLTSLPATWSTGGAYTDCPVSAYGMGGAAAPVLSVSPTSTPFNAVQGGSNPSPATVNVTNTGGGTLTFSTSSDSGWLTANPPSGTAPQAVQVAANINGLALGNYTGHITVTAAGAQGSPATITATLTVSASLGVSSITLNPTSVVGGNSSTGTVTLTGPAPAGGATVTLSSTVPTVASVPATVTVAANTNNANFSVTTNPVASSTPVTISGTYNSSTKTATLTVNPPTLSSVTLNPTSVVGGTSSTGTVTLTGKAPTGGAAVALTSNHTTAAQVPSNVTVAAGATTANFTATTSAVSNSTAVTITGTYGANQTAVLTVMPAGTVLFGDQTIESQVDSNPAGTAEAFPTTATVSGAVSSLTVYLNANSTAGTVYLGLYSNNSSNHPGTLVTQGNSTHPTAGAWNTIPVAAASVSSGTKYWIVILGTTSGIARFRDRANGSCSSESSAQSTLTSLPATWSTGAVYTDCPLSAYGK